MGGATDWRSRWLGECRTRIKWVFFCFPSCFPSPCFPLQSDWSVIIFSQNPRAFKPFLNLLIDRMDHQMELKVLLLQTLSQLYQMVLILLGLQLEGMEFLRLWKFQLELVLLRVWMEILMELRMEVEVLKEHNRLLLLNQQRWETWGEICLDSGRIFSPLLISLVFFIFQLFKPTFQ